MAQMNRNAAYLTVVDGITVWERLRVIRNFLEDRRIALALSEMNLEKNEEKLKDESVDKWEKKEIEIYKAQSVQLIKEAKNEIAFLEKLEAELAKKAEETRIEGKTDDEMYEINYFEELIQIQLLEVQSEIVTLGHPTPSTMKMLIKNPKTLDRAIQIGLLSEDAQKIATLTDASKIGLLGYSE